MARKFAELTRDWSPDRKKRVRDEVDRLNREITLTEIRKAVGLAQATVAQSLGVTPSEVSKLERRRRAAILAQDGRQDVFDIPSRAFDGPHIDEVSDRRRAPAPPLVPPLERFVVEREEIQIVRRAVGEMKAGQRRSTGQKKPLSVAKNASSTSRWRRVSLSGEDAITTPPVDQEFPKGAAAAEPRCYTGQGVCHFLWRHELPDIHVARFP